MGKKVKIDKFYEASFRVAKSSFFSQEFLSMTTEEIDQKIEAVQAKLEDFLTNEMDTHKVLENIYTCSRKSISRNSTLNLSGLRVEFNIKFEDNFTINSTQLRQRIIHLSCSEDEFALESLEATNSQYWNVDHSRSQTFTQLRITILLLK